MELTTQLGDLPRIGPARQVALARLGLATVSQLLAYFPRDYEDRRILPAIAPLPEEVPVCFVAMVTEGFRVTRIRAGMELCKGRISDQAAQVFVTFFNQSYVSKQLQYGQSYVFYGKLTGLGSRRQMTNPQFTPIEEALQGGGLHPVYPLTAGISQKLLVGLMRQALPLVAQLPDHLPSDLREQYGLAEAGFAHENIHFPATWDALALARKRLIFEELLCLSLGMALLRGRRQEGGGVAFADVDLTLFYQALSFAPTGAQRRALAEICQDFSQSRPMNRLLQGDVGSGKTAVAAACLYLTAKNGRQGALMAPTDLLARQHFAGLSTLLGGLGISVGLLLGGMPAKEKRKVREALAGGEISVVIGTHALLTEEVTFARLGLVVTDEQHRFGVDQRASLSAKATEGERAHVLVMSATPIPRTLALMVYGDLDVSILNELPPGRQPVETLLIGESKRARLYGFVERQVEAGRQVYLVCPTVEEGELAELKSAEAHGQHLAKEVFPHRRVAVLHGRMKAKEKEKMMAAFAEGEIEILVSTTVIEVGVDVPNATVMIVENAERFGLSQLHQLRGRVGRGREQSYCVLISEARGQVSRERLRTLCQSNDGFYLAEEDLKRRGPGDFFGARQHGLPQLHIASLVQDMETLQEARDAAQELLAQDPKLDAPRHRGLREQVLQLFSQHENELS